MALSPPTVQSFDTVYPADSVEFCPISDYRNYFVCGTYFLQTDEPAPETSDALPVQQTRIGKCWLFKSDNLGTFETAQSFDLPAILDVKWEASHSRHLNPHLAIADAAGCVRFYELSNEANKDNLAEKSSLLTEAQVLQCTSSSKICLSLDWSDRLHPDSTDGKVVTSISDGSVCISERVDGEFQVTSQWHAHEYEPWIAAWNYWNTAIIYTGGDDLSWKAWDSRIEPTAPVFHNKRSFEGGVTSIQAHPHAEHHVAVGSYDGYVRLFDTRKPLDPLASSDVGGGAWRVKWHPSVQRKDDLLVACMHGGFKVVRWSSDEVAIGNLPAADTNDIAADFQGHESLAYGVDWRTPEPDSDVRNETLIASCSFYDHSLKTWRA